MYSRNTQLIIIGHVRKSNAYDTSVTLGVEKPHVERNWRND